MDSQRSAFALMQQASKRRTPASISKQKAGAPSKQANIHPLASAFVPCPVCQASVPRALISSHVNSCLEAPAKRQCTPHRGQQVPQPVTAVCQDMGSQASCSTAAPVLATCASGPEQPAGQPLRVHRNDNMPGHVDAALGGACQPQASSSAAMSGPAPVLGSCKSPAAMPAADRCDLAARSCGTPVSEGACGAALSLASGVCANASAATRDLPCEAGSLSAGQTLGPAQDATLPQGAGDMSEQRRQDTVKPSQRTNSADLAHRSTEASHAAAAQPQMHDYPGDHRQTTPGHVPEQPQKHHSGNALAMMMHKQRERSKVHHFFMEQLPDGTFHYHWWTKASGPAEPSRQGSAGSEAQVPAQTDAGSGSAPGSTQQQGSAAEAGQHGLDGPAAAEHPDSSKAAGVLTAAPFSPAHTRPQAKAVWSASMQVSCAKLGLTGEAAAQKLTVRLATNVPPGDDVSWSAADLASNRPGPDGRFRGSPGVLKSALQKNVRLCQADSAVRCALHLIKEDASEFLRRCSIICLEDAVLHPDLPLLVWLMAAHAKGYQLGRGLASACLRVVHQLASVPLRDHYPDAAALAKAVGAAESASAGAPMWSPAALFDSDGGLGAAKAMLVRCIAIRSAYGGMGGDVVMLNGFAALWAARLSRQLAPPTALGAAWQPARCNEWLRFLERSFAACGPHNTGGAADIASISPMRQADVPLSAIDFHISNIAEELMAQPAISQAAAAASSHALGGDPCERLRHAMWLFRSSLNRKRWLAPAGGSHAEAGDVAQHGEMEGGEAENRALQPLWQVAAGPADAWSATFIRRRFF